MMRKYIIFLLLFNFVLPVRPDSLEATQLLWAKDLQAQEYRDRMKIPSVTLYETMLNFTVKEDYEKVSKSVPFIHEILEVIKAKFEVDLEKELKTALENKEKELIILTIRKTIFYDMKDLFSILISTETIAEQSTVRLRTFIRTGYLDYLLLSPKIKEKEFKTDLTLKKVFQRVFYLIGATSPYAVEEKTTEKAPTIVDWNAVSKELNVIEKEILHLFPEFKPPEKKKE